jgi:hypothetical protein
MKIQILTFKYTVKEVFQGEISEYTPKKGYTYSNEKRYKLSNRIISLLCVYVEMDTI